METKLYYETALTQNRRLKIMKTYFTQVKHLPPAIFWWISFNPKFYYSTPNDISSLGTRDAGKENKDQNRIFFFSSSLLTPAQKFSAGRWWRFGFVYYLVSESNTVGIILWDGCVHLRNIKGIDIKRVCVTGEERRDRKWIFYVLDDFVGSTNDLEMMISSTSLE